jgi:hypothetical protein
MSLSSYVKQHEHLCQLLNMFELAGAEVTAPLINAKLHANNS